jgi:predicted secreted protein
VAKQARKEARELCTAALEEWKKVEEARKQHNRELMAKYQMELEQWKDNKERAKMEKHQFAWKKPMQGKLEVPLPKLVVVEGTAGDELDIDGDHENASDEDDEQQ